MKRLTVQNIFTFEAAIKAADDLHHSRFAGTVFAHQANDFARHDFEICSPQRLNGTV